MTQITQALEAALFGVTLFNWVTLLLLGAAFSIGLVLLRRLTLPRLASLSARTTNQVDDVALEFLRNTYIWFIVAVGAYVALLVSGFPAGAVEVISEIFFLVVLLQVAFWGNGIITWWIERFEERKMETDAAAVTTVQTAGFLCRMTLFMLVLLLGLDNLDYDVTTLIAGLGVAGIAVGLALQDVFGDLLASLSIVFDKPFVVGDFIIVDQYLGTVEHIGLETTRIRSLSGEEIIMPNSDLINSRIRNYKRMYERRIAFSLGVTYQTPHEKLARIPDMLREIVEEQEKARFDRSHFKAFGDFALTFEVVYYVLDPDYNTYMNTQQAINLGVHRAFEDEGIDFAYPTQTVFMEPGEAVERSSSPAKSA